MPPVRKGRLMRRFLVLAPLVFWTYSLLAMEDAAPAVRTTFTVRQVDDGVIYLDGGRNDGLALGMALNVKRAQVLTGGGDGEFKASTIIAKLTVISVSNTSAQCEVRSQSGGVRRGDTAVLVLTERNKQARTPVVPVTPLQQEPRDGVIKAPLVQMDSENAQTASAPATTAKATPTPAPVSGQISIADAAREIARRKREKNGQATTASASATAPAKPSAPAAPAPATNAASTPNKVPSASPTPATNAAIATSSPAPSAANPDARASAGKTAPPATAPASVPATSSSPIAPTTAAVAASKPAPTPAPDTSAAAAGNPITSAVSKKRPPAAPSTLATTSAPAATVQPAAPPVATAAAKSVPETRASAAAPSSPDVAVAEPSAAPAAASGMPAAGAIMKTDFKVKYVAEDAVYIDGGKGAGLVEGMVLTLKHPGDPSANGSDLANRPGGGGSLRGLSFQHFRCL